MDLTNLYVEVLREADKCIRREHEWLCARQDQIARIMAGKLADSELLAEVQRRYRSWSTERAWFTRSVGTVTFEAVCEHVGVDLDEARSVRAKYYALPFSAALLRIRCESPPSKMPSSPKVDGAESGC